MKLRNVKRWKILCALTVPAFFLLTVLILNSKLKFSSDSEVKNQRKMRLIAAYDSQRNVPRFTPEKLKHSDPLDLFYDSEKLMMLGSVNNDQDQKAKEKGL